MIYRYFWRVLALLIFVGISGLARGQTVPTIPRTGPNNAAGQPTTSLADIAGVFAGKADVDVTQAGTGAVAVVVSAKLKQSCVSLLDFGGDPTDTNASDTAIANFYAAMIAQKKCGYVPAGEYKVTAQTVFDLSTVHGTGMTLVGDGTQQSIFDARQVTASPNFLVEDAGGSTGSPASAFYIRIKGIGFLGNIAGTVLSLGKSDLSDYLNNIDVDAWVGNASTSTSCIAVQVNGATGPNILELVANCGGHGDAIQVQGAAFTEFHVSGGNADNGMHFTGSGYMFGDQVFAPDFEGVSYGVVIDGAHVAQNTFTAGQYGYNLSGIDATAGANNLFINPNFAPTGTVSNIVGGVGAYVINAEGITTGPQALQWNLTNAAGTGWQVQEASDGTVTQTNYVAAKPMIWNLQSGGSYSFEVNGVQEAFISSSESHFAGPMDIVGTSEQALNLNSNGNVGFQAQVGTDGQATVTNYVTGKSLVFDIQTGGDYQFAINGVLQGRFDANGFEGPVGGTTTFPGAFTTIKGTTLKLQTSALPTTCTSQPSGTVINSGNVLNICP